MTRFIFVFLIVICISSPFQVLSNVAFYYFGVENGLPETQIHYITQDSSGFIWLAGQNTLFRFDGNHFKNYLNRGSGQILKGKINTLFVDSKGILRVGTEFGFLQYNSLYDKFTEPEPGWERVHVLVMDEDKNGRIWIGTDEGLACFDPESKKTEWYTCIDTIKTTGNDVLPFSVINQLVCLPNGKIWFSGATSDLCLFDPESREIVESNVLAGKILQGNTISKLGIKNGSLFISTLSGGLFIYNQESKETDNKTFDNNGANIHSFQYAEDSILWLATNNGLVRYNLENDKYKFFTNEPLDPLSLTRTALVFVFADKDKNIWVSSGIKGVNYGLNNIPFSHFEVSGTGSNSLINKEVTSMMFDRMGNMWIGYEAGFIEMINRNGTAKKLIKKANIHEQTTGSTLVLFNDSKNRIWQGGWRTGLYKLNNAGAEFERPVFENDSIAKIMEVADIRGIAEDTDGNIWLTIHGMGIGCYKPENGQFKMYRFNQSNPLLSLSNDYTFDLCTDDQNNLWVATAHGVTRINLTDGIFYSYFHDEKNDNSLTSNTVNTVYQSFDNKLWAGSNNGLNVYLPSKNGFKPVLTESEIPFLNISAITSVKPGEIWFSSSAGIVRLKYVINADSVLQTGYTVFDRSDGLFSTTFFPRSVATNKNGFIYFGGNESVDFFDPVKVEAWIKPEARPRITDVLVDGSREYINGAENFENNPAISLKFNDRMLSILFTTLQFNQTKSSNIRYKLENFNTDWVYPQNEQIATFTNLRPDKYRFLLEVKGNNGDWKSLDPPLSIEVNPPFWRTIPFLIVVLILSASMFYLIHLFQSKRFLDRQKELEKVIEKRTAELMKKNKELEIANKTKDKFFSIVSHDLRSPFSGLIGLIELLNDSDNELNEQKKKELLKITEISAKNTFDFLETLLTWARSQMNQTGCSPEFGNLSVLLAQNIELKKPTAENKGIKIIKHLPEKLEAYFDGEMINTVVRNLLSNAIKFTKPGGIIDISLLENDSEVEVIIADTGIGMSEDDLLHMFDLGKSSRKGTMGERGTGLGLIICKEFIEKNNGKLWANKNEPQGTVFHFSLSVSKF